MGVAFSLLRFTLSLLPSLLAVSSRGPSVIMCGPCGWAVSSTVDASSRPQ